MKQVENYGDNYKILNDQLRSGGSIKYPHIWMDPKDFHARLIGNKVCVGSMAFSIKNKLGKPKYYIIMHEDITARVEAEEALRNAHQDLTVAHEALRAAYESVEQKVAERTAELEEANRKLQAEIDERRRLQIEFEKQNTELDSHCLRILSIPLKRTHRTIIGYLEADELMAVLQSVSLEKPLAHRDLSLLVFAYNTGARVHEIASACKKDIIPGKTPSIRILGKGNKERIVPLWEGTIQLIETYLHKYRVCPKDFTQSQYLFLGNRGQKLTRFQVGRIITGYIKKAKDICPSLCRKRLCAHSMRHTTAVHLLQAGAEENTIKAWLGHSSVESTQIYLDLDLMRKREVLDLLITQEFAKLFLQGKQARSRDNIALIKWLDML